jgi:hypothetical protein
MKAQQVIEYIEKFIKKRDLPKEWKKVLPAIDTTSLNRAIGQYNALQ